MIFSRSNVRRDQLKSAIDALDGTGTSTCWCVNAVYTRQTDSAWFFFTGQCAAAAEDLDDCMQRYSNIAFVRKTFAATNGGKIAKAIMTEGLQVHPELPPIRLTQENPNFTELIVPSHATVSGLPLRSFTTQVEGSAFFNEAALVDYVLPYRMSASAYLKEFMGLSSFRGKGSANPS